MYNPISFTLALIRIILIVILLLIFVPPLLLADKLFKLSPQSAFKVRRAWVKIAKVILGIRVQVNGTPHPETALYVSNHRSFSDPLIIADYIDAYVIAKAEVGDLPLISTGAEKTGVIYVQRDNKESRSSVKKTMVKTLLEGKNVLVFPEGTTNDKKQLLPYKKGTFFEAAQNGIPVVPIIIEYKTQKDLWFQRSIFSHHFIQFGKLLTDTRLEIGPAFTNSDGEQLRVVIENWSTATVKRLHKNWGSLFDN
jgi:1-acyl-sn-glycerol-3-phosphate acyltransferase